MEHLLETAAANQRRAREIIRTTGLEAIWRSVGAEPRLVGSLRTGLLMTHRDIDYHIYSAPLRTADSFAAMARLAQDRHIRRVEFANLLDAEDRCLEWHAQYVDDEGAAWQIDMIHMETGSPWDGYFERVADRIAAVLTDETRLTILRLKYETPPAEKIPGIRYYEAVLRDGVRTREEFAAWLAAHPAGGDRHLDALTDRTRGPFFLHRTYVFSAPAASYNRKRFQKQTAKKRNMQHGTPEHTPA